MTKDMRELCSCSHTRNGHPRDSACAKAKCDCRAFAATGLLTRGGRAKRVVRVATSRELPQVGTCPRCGRRLVTAQRIKRAEKYIACGGPGCVPPKWNLDVRRAWAEYKRRTFAKRDAGREANQ